MIIINHSTKQVLLFLNLLILMRAIRRVGQKYPIYAPQPWLIWTYLIFAD